MHVPLYLSMKDLENWAEFNLLQNLHLCTQKSVCARNFEPLGEIGANFSLQLSSRTQLAKISRVKRKSGTARVNTTANGAKQKKLVLHVQLRCGSLSITTQVSLLANEFGVQSVLRGHVSLAVVNQIVSLMGPISSIKFVRYILNCAYVVF